MLRGPVALAVLALGGCRGSAAPSSGNDGAVDGWRPPRRDDRRRGCRRGERRTWRAPIAGGATNPRAVDASDAPATAAPDASDVAPPRAVLVVDRSQLEFAESVGCEGTATVRLSNAGSTTSGPPVADGDGPLRPRRRLVQRAGSLRRRSLRRRGEVPPRLPGHRDRSPDRHRGPGGKGTRFRSAGSAWAWPPCTFNRPSSTSAGYGWGRRPRASSPCPRWARTRKARSSTSPRAPTSPSPGTAVPERATPCEIEISFTPAAVGRRSAELVADRPRVWRSHGQRDVDRDGRGGAHGPLVLQPGGHRLRQRPWSAAGPTPRCGRCNTGAVATTSLVVQAPALPFGVSRDGLHRPPRGPRWHLRHRGPVQADPAGDLLRRLTVTSGAR
jgi:hypothetical protein